MRCGQLITVKTGNHETCTCLGPGLILWYDLSDGKGTRGLVRGNLRSVWLRIGTGGGYL